MCTIDEDEPPYQTPESVARWKQIVVNEQRSRIEMCQRANAIHRANKAKAAATAA